jgi:DNA-binding NarL/FixJ family response regulator
MRKGKWCDRIRKAVPLLPPYVEERLHTGSTASGAAEARAVAADRRLTKHSPHRRGEEVAMKQRPPVEDSARPHRLNPRDIDVLQCLADGKSTAQVAAALTVTGNTARTRIRRVEGKLDVTDRAAAVRAARDLGVLRIPQPRPPVG